MERRTFVQSTIASSAMAFVAARLPTAWRTATSAPSFDLEEVSIADVQGGLRSGKYSSRYLVEAYLARIDELDQRGPAVNAILQLNPDALAIADSLDAERKAGHVRGPLHGVPIVLKDNIATADRMLTTAGSLALVGAPVPRDAFVADRLRAAGAVLLAKTNLSEWANFRSTHASSGWSGRGGQARNPYVLDRSPSGSSSGSAIAVASNFCVAGVGTETDGSIVSPSSCCGLVGLKPTVGLLSRAGIVPISHTQDTPGPMCRTVRDAAVLLTVMAGVDARDPATAAARSPIVTDYTAGLDRDGLRGARIGIPRAKLFGYSPVSDALAQAAIDIMKQQGAEIIDPADIATVGQFDDAELEVLLYDFKTDLNAYLAELGPSSPVHTIADIIAFNEAHHDDEEPFFAQELMVQAQAKGPLTDAAYRSALAKCRTMSRRDGIDKVMDAHRLDALVAPTSGPAWLIDLVNGDPTTGSSTTPAAVAGYPSITVPMGFAFGLPVGLSFFGRAFSEPTLLKLAYAYEQAASHRQPPQFRATADLGATRRTS